MSETRVLAGLRCCLVLLLGACASPAPLPAKAAQGAVPREAGATILVSIDGFRADYLDRGITPHLSALAASGVHARVMRPSFPSLTFPSHYTLVTGLRPDKHGIVDNTMEDPQIPGVTFRASNEEAVGDRRWWDDAEPLWVTAERAGIRTATMFWPGSEAPVRGVRPSDWRPFDAEVSNDDRVDQVLAWLARPERARPRFLTLYFSEVDHVGHEFGPDHARTNDAVRNVDAAVGRLVAGLRSAGLGQRVNLVIVSDHGMAAVSAERVVQLETIADPATYRAVSTGPLADIQPQAGREADLAGALLKPHPHMSCWRKGELPERLGYGQHRRVGAFVCLAEPGWLVLSGRKRGTPSGAHGYDNMAPEMAALFIANGPAFQAGQVIEELGSRDVYPLLARLVGVTPQPNEGGPDVFQAVLRGP